MRRRECALCRREPCQERAADGGVREFPRRAAAQGIVADLAHGGFTLDKSSGLAASRGETSLLKSAGEYDIILVFFG